MQADAWTAVVRRRSADFERARSSNDFAAAMDAARATIEACRQIVEPRREQRRRRRRSWWSSSPSVDTQDDQVIEFYLGVAEQMARAYDRLKLECARVESLPPPAPSPLSPQPRRVGELENIHRRLEHVAALHERVAAAVDVAGPLVESLDANVEHGAANQRRAELAIRHYHDRHVTVEQAALPAERAYMTLPLLGLVMVGAVWSLAAFG